MIQGVILFPLSPQRINRSDGWFFFFDSGKGAGVVELARLESE